MYRVISLRVISLFLSAILLLGGAGSVSAFDIPTARDLSSDGKLASRQGVAILLLFSSNHCPYCKKLEEEVIQPLMLSGDYDDKVIVRRINLDAGGELIDFAGDPVSVSRFSRNYRATLTPTVVIVGPDGKQLADRLRGISVVDYYWEGLDKAIESALSRLAASKQFALGQQ